MAGNVMKEPRLFEVTHRGHSWRLEVQSYRGRTFCNWRKWYLVGDEWRPTREGCTFPLDRLQDLTAALMRRHGLEPPDWLGD